MNWLIGIARGLFRRISRGLSQYEEPQPFVILRHAGYRLGRDRAELTNDGCRQMDEAAAKLRTHYGDTAVFVVYAVGADMSGHLSAPASYLAEKLGVGATDEFGVNARTLLGRLKFTGAVPVLVTNQPMVQSLIREAYRDHPDEARLLDAKPPHGVPYFLMLDRLKWPDMAIGDPFKLRPDKR